MKRISELIEAKRLPPPATRKVLRTDAGLTLEDVAGQLGVSKTAIWLWERGDRVPTGLNRIAYVALLNQLRDAL